MKADIQKSRAEPELCEGLALPVRSVYGVESERCLR